MVRLLRDKGHLDRRLGRGAPPGDAKAQPHNTPTWSQWQRVPKHGLTAFDAACGVGVEATGISDGVGAGGKGAACGGRKTGAVVGGAVGGTDWGNRVLVDGEVMSPTRRAARGKRCSRLVWQENKA